MRHFNAVILVACIAIFGSVALAASAPVKCSDLVSGHGHDSHSTPLRSNSLWIILNEKTFNGTDVIRHLSDDPKLKSLFEASAGVFEGYSIEEHTRMVFEVFAEQYRPYSVRYQFPTHPDIRLFQTLKFTIALHDIGKPYAIEAGDKNRQHEFTLPILDRAFVEFGFSDHESKLARALVGNDIMGDLVRGSIDAQEAKAKLSQVAAQAEMSLAEFAPLQFLFYVIDAASYPNLRQRIFLTTADGLLIPKRSQFESLWAIITNP